MAKEVAEVVAGVSPATFNAHTHNYRKLATILVDDSNAWASPLSAAVVDNATTYKCETGSLDLAGVGVTVATSPTSTPV